MRAAASGLRVKRFARVTDKYKIRKRMEKRKKKRRLVGPDRIEYNTTTTRYTRQEQEQEEEYGRETVRESEKKQTASIEPG